MRKGELNLTDEIKKRIKNRLLKKDIISKLKIKTFNIIGEFLSYEENYFSFC